jgi:hypothetical protein
MIKIILMILLLLPAPPPVLFPWNLTAPEEGTVKMWQACSLSLCVCMLQWARKPWYSREGCRRKEYKFEIPGIQVTGRPWDGCFSYWYFTCLYTEKWAWAQTQVLTSCAIPGKSPLLCGCTGLSLSERVTMIWQPKCRESQMYSGLAFPMWHVWASSWFCPLLPHCFTFTEKTEAHTGTVLWSQSWWVPPLTPKPSSHHIPWPQHVSFWEWSNRILRTIKNATWGGSKMATRAQKQIA